MSEDLEIPDAGKIDNKLLLATLRNIRREQQEINDLLLSLTHHILEMDKRFGARLDAFASTGTAAYANLQR